MVGVEDDAITVDVAGRRGARKGDVVELWRPLVLRHPVTRKPVRDRYPIGAVRLHHVGDNLARIVDISTLERAPEPGDIVVLRRAPAKSTGGNTGTWRPGPVPASAAAAATPHDSSSSTAGAAESARAKPPCRSGPAKKCPACPSKGSPEANEALLVAELFESLRGASLVKRVNRYEGWVRRYPQSSYAVVLYEEAAMLRELAKLHDRHPDEDDGKPQVSLASFVPPEEALVDRPLTLSLQLDGVPKAVILHLRTVGQPSFETLLMKPTGRGYYSVTLPAKRIEEPAMELFVEATTGDGEAHALTGGVDAPIRIDIRTVPEPERWQPPRATVTLWTDYADYNRFRGNDAAWQTEGYFGMRFGDIGVRALRSGFGVYRGVGGTLEDLDENELSARRVGLTYGYLEGEFGFHELFSLTARPVVGLGDGGITGGALTMVRIGNDLGTNLQIGGEFLGTVGVRAIAQFELNVLEDWPMMLRSEVTNQPGGSAVSTDDVRPDDEDALAEMTSTGTNDIGVRGIAQVGYRIADSFVVAVRGSYQGRTINHSGPGFGGAISYSW